MLKLIFMYTLNRKDLIKFLRPKSLFKWRLTLLSNYLLRLKIPLLASKIYHAATAVHNHSKWCQYSSRGHWAFRTLHLLERSFPLELFTPLSNEVITENTHCISFCPLEIIADNLSGETDVAWGALHHLLPQPDFLPRILAINDIFVPVMLGVTWWCHVGVVFVWLHPNVKMTVYPRKIPGCWLSRWSSILFFHVHLLTRTVYLHLLAINLE